MILQSILHMIQVLIYIQSVKAAFQKCVHALKSSFPHIQAIIYGVFERSHFYLNMEYSWMFNGQKNLPISSIEKALFSGQHGQYTDCVTHNS